MEALASLLSFPYAYNLSKRELYEKVIRDVMDGKAGDIHPEIYQAYSDNLRKAVGGVFRSDDYGDKYFDLQAQLQSNVSRFAAYKAYHLTEQLKKKREEWTNDDDFKKVAKAMMNTFNRYQAAEYNTATARARTAKQWTDFNSDPIANELYPNLKWLPSRSANPREEHIPFYGLVLPKTDPFWQHNQPGNLWNCKCDWEETDDPAAATRPATIHAKGLEGNPAVTGEIFTQECTYFKQVSGKRNQDYIENYARKHSEIWDVVKTINGRVLESSLHGGGEKEANEDTAKYFANKYGRTIYLLGRNNGATSADAYDATLGCKVEYKNNGTATINSIDKALREANKQAPVAVIVIESDISMGKLRDAISDRIKRSENITSVTLVRNGADVTYEREEMLSSRFKIQLEDFK